MSPLTKLFVVLLVILSLLTTAATVVFVNQTQNSAKMLADAKAEAAAARSAASEAEAAAGAQRDQAQEAIRNSQNQIEQFRQSANQLQMRINELAAQNADATTKVTLSSADQARLTEALKSAQETNAHQAEQITQLRTTNDERLKQNVELNTRVTELTDRSQVLERELRFANEQLAEAKTTADRQGAMLRDAGINPKMASAGTGAGAPPINGVIRARRDIAGIPYAVISVGSNDGVAKGMEFKIVNRATGQFLGVLTVDSVEATEATGRLSGPKLPEVRPGVEVRTQL